MSGWWIAAIVAGVLLVLVVGKLLLLRVFNKLADESAKAEQNTKL